MQNVLIPTDFSDNARKAAKYALSIFGSETQFTLLNTFEIPHSGATMLISISDIMEKDSLQLLESEQSGLEKEFPQLKDQIHIRTHMGTPDSVIRKLVDDNGYDIVIMGTKGATGLKGALIGSIASNVMQNVKCPVIAVPHEAELRVPRKMLFAVDDKSLSEGIFPKALAEMAKKFNAEVMVLNVVAKGEMKHVGISKDSHSIPTSVFDDVEHSFHFVENDEVNQGIEGFILENKVDLLAMVTRRDDFIAKLFGLSSTRKMMLHTKVPLMAIHGSD